MKIFSYKNAEEFVLRKLLDKDYIGARAVLLENIPKGAPKEYRAAITRAAEKLLKMGFLQSHKKHYGLHVSIDPQKIPEIRAYLAAMGLLPE